MWSPALWVLLACTLAFELVVLRRLGFDWLTTLLVLGGTVLCIEYLSYTSLTERNYDGSSHAAYVQFIRERKHLPELSSCRFCAHPPLYYALGALFSEGVLADRFITSERALQWLSLLLFFGFVVFALLVIRRTTSDPATRWVATLLVVFWPSSIIHSVRVHNDALASLLMIASIYWLAEWDRRDEPRDFYAALAAAALALLTKASAYAVAATLLVFVFLRLRSKQEPLRTSLERCGLSILVLAAAGSIAASLRDSGETVCQTLLGRACSGRYVPPVADTLGRFVTFHPGDFLWRIETEPADPFMNRFLKSVLFGVEPLGEDFEGPRHTAIASIFCGLLLVVVGVCLVGALRLRADSLRRYRVYLAAPLILFGFLVGFRILAPNEFHEDFRHIFPALVPLCLGYAKITARWGTRRRALKYGGRAVALAMALSSFVFFLRLE